MQIAIYHDTKLALGGDVTIVIAMKKGAGAELLIQNIWQKVFSFERQFSRFLPDSELSQFNRMAGIRHYISKEFNNLLKASQTMSDMTDGLYNPFILPAIQRAGYLKSAVSAYSNDVVDDFRSRAVVPADRLVITKDRRATIPYGTAIDIGGCAKGYLADELADILDEANVEGYWVSLSGDMVTNGFDDKGMPWKTYVMSAHIRNTNSLFSISGNGERLHIATSGTFLRPGQTNLDGHHLIDPTTGQPARTDIKLATVVASSAVQADVFASCAVIVGSDKAIPYLKTRGAIGAVIQSVDKDYNYGLNIHKSNSNKAVHAN